MTRICPSCKSRLGQYEKFFCTSCGANLPAKLVDSRDNYAKISEVSYVTSIAESSVGGSGFSMALSKINYSAIAQKKNIHIAVSILIFLAISFAAYKFLFPLLTLKNNGLKPQNNTVQLVPSDNATQSTATPTVEQAKQPKYVLGPNCSFATGAFSDSGLAKFVPYEAILFLEVPDRGLFLTQVFDSKLFVDKNVQDFMETNVKNFSGPLGFFVMKEEAGYSFVFVSKLATEKIVLQKGDEEFVFQSDGYVVVTSQKKLMPEFQDITAGLSKSFVLNPTYASARSVLPKEGKLEIVAVGRNGKSYLYQILESDLSLDINSAVSAFLDSGLDYAVVL